MAININPELRAASRSLLDEIKTLDENKANDLYRGLEDQVNADPDKVIQNISVDLLDDNDNNHFHRIEGDAWEEFVGSIKEMGVITPLIVRPIGERYEILAGHNRKYGAIAAGIKELPCRVVNVDDVDASVIVAITNKQRENTTDLEWGWAYRSTYEALVKSVGRPKEDSEENGPNGGTLPDDTQNNNGPNGGTLSRGGRTQDIVAEKYGVSKGTIFNKMRLTFLIPQLYALGTSEGYSQKILIDLSYLTVYEQDILTAIIDADKLKMTDEIAARLREMSADAAKNGTALKGEEIAALMTAEAVSEKKPPRPKKYAVDEHLFPVGIKKGEREDYIFRALRYIIDNEVQLYRSESEL